MESCFFRISEELAISDPEGYLLYHLINNGNGLYKVEWQDPETKMIDEDNYEEKTVEALFENGDWVKADLEKDENKPCWNCKQLDELCGCKLNEGICPVWIEPDETENFKCFEKDGE